MCDTITNIKALDSFMQTEVYSSLDKTTKTAIESKKTELCGNYFLHIAANLHRNKYKGCYAPHKAVMIIAIIDLIESGHFTTNAILLDKELKNRFKEVWHQTVPKGSPFKCDYRNPFTYMNSEPFWNLSANKDMAYITWESYHAFSHKDSNSAIKSFLIRSIIDDTISREYSNNFPNINMMVAENLISIIPLLGFLVAV